MSTPNEIAELLRKGIEAAREGKRADARRYFEQVVDLDDKSEKGWFWLASVVDTDEERRICLGNVLHINPNNEKAKRALDALQAKAKEKQALPGDEEVVPGLSRRRMTLVIGLGAVVVVVILLIALVVIVGNNSREAAARSTADALALAATANAATLTAVVEQATATAVAEAATQAALVTPVLPTRSVPTLPPTWTPTPEATATPTRETHPLPVDLSGRLMVWGGQDMLSVGYLPLGYYDFDIGGQYTQIGDALGRNISVSANGQRVVYAKYDVLLYSSLLEAINVNGTQRESLADRWTGQNILQVDSPRYGGLNRQYIVFVAMPANRQTPQVYLLDLNAASGTNPVRQLTDDDAAYSDPALSPDGTKVVTVYSNPNSAAPVVDIISIDVATGGKVPVTNDGVSYVESSPYFTKDGTQIIFAAEASNQPGNSDIYIKNTNGTGTALPLYRSPANDIHPVLSPDGRFLAFASNATGSYNIYLYDQNTSQLSQLTDTADDHYPGDWWQP